MALEAQGRVHDYPSAEEVWAHRAQRGWTAWSEETGIPRKQFTAWFTHRGWKAGKRYGGPGSGSGPVGSRITHAPCAGGCGRREIPVEGLNEDRECGQCSRSEDREVSPGVTAADLESERAAYLRRGGSG